jgi:hypothetical protein
LVSHISIRTPSRHHPGAEGDAVGQSARALEGAVGLALPFERLQVDPLLRPEGRDVGVRQVEEPVLAPDRFRHVGHDIAVLVPGGEDADLGLALGAHGPVEEAEARVPAAGVRQHQERRVGGAPRAVVGADVEALQGGGDLVGRQAGGLGDFIRAEAVVPDHVLEPASQLGVVLRPAGVGRLGGRHGGAGEKQHDGGSKAAQHGSLSWALDHPTSPPAVTPAGPCKSGRRSRPFGRCR